MNFLEESRRLLSRIGFPSADLTDLPPSNLTFPDGAQFRVEAPTINSAEAGVALLGEAEKIGVTINRIVHTYGIMRITDHELSSLVRLAKEWGVELFMAPGPRAIYDIGGQVRSNTAAALAMGYRLRGMEQVVRALEDVRRACQFGCRGILVFDEGLLKTLSLLRSKEMLPSDLRLKASSGLGYSNPISYKILEELGADSVNLQRDLEIPMISSTRSVVRVPLDIHADNPEGFIRTYDAPMFVRVAAPVYIKCGGSALEAHDIVISPSQAKEMTRSIAATVEMINRIYPEAKQSRKRATNFAVPT